MVDVSLDGVAETDASEPAVTNGTLAGKERT